MLLGIASIAQAQWAERRVSVEARGGLNAPTFDISDAVDAGPSVGLGAAVQFAPKLWLMGDVDLGFHSGADLAGGGEAPDVKVYHYVAKLGYELLSEGQSPWSVIVNAGAGALTFDADGAGSNTYPAINVGAKIGYRLSPLSRAGYSREESEFYGPAVERGGVLVAVDTEGVVSPDQAREVLARHGGSTYGR
jgi:hypothetical protein